MIDLESGQHAVVDRRTLSVSRRASLPSRCLVLNLRRNRAPALKPVACAAQYFAESIGGSKLAADGGGAETWRTAT